MTDPKIALVASDTPEATAALKRLEKRYGGTKADDADIIVALGGDGFMLESLHRVMGSGKPIYGMNCGTVGFLMNQYHEDDLPQRVAEAEQATLHPLRMTVDCVNGETSEAIAVNEVSLLRESRQAAKVGIAVDGVQRMDELICDGIIISTAAGSTAYNLSAHGPIIPIGGQLLALTPISAFRPRRWRGALLPATAEVIFEVHESKKRPVSATADFTEVRDVARVRVREDQSLDLNLLFDPEHDLEERIIKEQFQP